MHAAVCLAGCHLNAGALVGRSSLVGPFFWVVARQGDVVPPFCELAISSTALPNALFARLCFVLCLGLGVCICVLVAFIILINACSPAM